MNEKEQEELFPEEEVNKIARQQLLVDKIGRKQGGPFPNTVKPEKLFQKFHKTRKKRTKQDIFNRAEGYLRWKEASDAINTEEATPLDE